MFEITHPIVAVYSLDEVKGEVTRPVLAWSDSGEPYVLGEKTLVLASTYPGFTGLRFPQDAPGPREDRPVPVVVKPRRQSPEETPS